MRQYRDTSTDRGGTGVGLYLLSQQLLHGLSELRRADHPVAVGVELKTGRKETVVLGYLIY